MSPACSEEPSPGEPWAVPWRVHWGRGGRGGWDESSVANSLCEEILTAGEFPASARLCPAHTRALGLQAESCYYSRADFCFLFKAKKDIKLSKRLLQHLGWVEMLGESLPFLCTMGK